jgi:hypothetical protein
VLSSEVGSGLVDRIRHPVCKLKVVIKEVGRYGAHGKKGKIGQTSSYPEVSGKRKKKIKPEALSYNKKMHKRQDVSKSYLG